MKINKSVLLNASSGTDVQYAGGEIIIQGLDAIKQSRVLDFSQLNYRGETPQVLTVGANAYTPAGGITYKLLMGDTQRTVNGQIEPLKPYAYTTPLDITALGGTPQLQREAIHLALIAKINASNRYNFVTAATLGSGTGFTITDNAGYYPYNRQGMSNRLGSTVVKTTLVNGYGFTPAALTLTTKAIYSSGVGANLANSAPIFDLVTGNLIQGNVDVPTVFGTGALATAGQRYNYFSISGLTDAAMPTIAESYRGFRVNNQSVWVDNGTGTSNANLAGYIAFEKEMHRGMTNRFFQDPSAQVDFLDNVILFQGAGGTAPTNAGENKMVADDKWVYNQLGAQAIAAPTPGPAGLILDQSLVANAGAEYTPSLLTGSPKQFVVGKQFIHVFARLTANVWANAGWLVALRTKAPHQANFAIYNNFVSIGSLVGTPTVVTTQGNLNSGGLIVTPTGAAALVNTVSNTVEIIVNMLGVVTVKLNDVVYPVYSAYTSPTVNTPLVFAQGTVLVPSLRYTQVAAAAPVLVAQEFVAIGGAPFKA